MPKIIFLCGGPGSGKGTQADLIKAKYVVHHQNTGELLRSEVAKGDALGLRIKQVQDEGKLVTSDLVVELLKKNIQGKQGWHLIDGFPRNFENIDMWNKKMMKFCDVKFMMFFECSQKEMEARVLSRGQTSGRSDDNPDTIAKRVDTFVRITTPMVEWYDKQGKAVRVSAE